MVKATQNYRCSQQGIWIVRPLPNVFKQSSTVFTDKLFVKQQHQPGEHPAPTAPTGSVCDATLNDYPVDTYLPLRSRMALTNYSSKLSAALRWRSWWSSEDVTTGKVDDRWKQECMISHRRWRDVPRKIVLIELRCSANRILIPTGTGRYGIKWHTSLWARRDDQCGMQIKCKFYMVLRWIMICE